MGVPAAKLIACAGGRYELVSVFYASGRNQCRKLGLEPLPASYAPAQARVLELGRALVRLQASAFCVPAATFATGAQRVLQRLGWSGWRVRAMRPVGGGDLPGEGS